MADDRTDRPSLRRDAVRLRRVRAGETVRAVKAGIAHARSKGIVLGPASSVG